MFDIVYDNGNCNGIYYTLFTMTSNQNIVLKPRRVIYISFIEMKMQIL